jgi:uncharacterized YigZ family protein
MESHDIVYQGGCGEITEKKSRFIAHVFPIHSEEQALQYIEQLRKQYWDARHNCHAFVLGANHEISRCSDDGEPSGTAGRPILEVLLGAGVHNVLVVVTRYFGGTLLGTGGLVRAYSAAAQAGLDASTILTKQFGRKAVIDADYNVVGKLQYIAAESSLTIEDTQYTERVVMTVLVPEEHREIFAGKVTEATAGQARIEWSEPVSFAVQDGKILICEAVE